MPVTKEFIVLMEDRPRARSENSAKRSPIVGEHSRASILPDRREKRDSDSSWDNPTTAKTVLDTERLTYEAETVVQAKLPHRPGEIARVASRPGEANININHAYYVWPAPNPWQRLLWRAGTAREETGL